MPTRDAYVKQPIEARLARLARAADDLAAAIRGRDDAVLSCRPEPKAWSAKEIILRALTPGQWERGGLVPTGARVSFGQLVAASAAHDDAHLDQLERALAGRP